MRPITDLIGALLAALRRLIAPLSDTVTRLDRPRAGGITGVMRDRARRRVLPFRLYSPPADSPLPAPVVIFSHGLGGSRDAAPHLGRALAKAGYYAFFLQHPGSDRSLIQGSRGPEDMRRRLMAAVRRPEGAQDRFLDIPFALDQIEHMNRQGRLAGRLDTGRIGMAGHSYGARGTMAAAGQRMGVHGTRFKEPRIRAGVVLSPALPGGRGTQAAASGVYDAIGIPLLHITGTEDGMPLAGTAFDPVTRTLPFRRIDRTDQYLLVLDGATHDTFGGGRPRGKSAPGLPPGPERQRHERAVAEATVLFFDAYLKDAPAARRRLHNGFAASLAPGDRFEVK